VRILRALTHEKQPQSISELSSALGLHKATLVRLLRTLMAEGVVVQDAATKRYALSPASAVRLAEFAAPLLGFSDAVQRVLDELTMHTGSTAVLALPDYTGRRGSAVMDSLPPQPVRIEPMDEPARPLHTIAAGKCYLAYLPDRELDAYIRSGLEKLTPLTISSPLRLRRELRQVRAQGYAVNRGEAVQDCRYVAIPLRDPSGVVVGGLAVGYPAAFPPRADLSQLIAHLHQSADTLSSIFSYEWWATQIRELSSRVQAEQLLPDSPDPGFGAGPMPVVRSVARMIRIIHLLHLVPEGLTVGEVGRRRGIHNLVAMRLLRTLEREGLAERDAPRKGYRLNPLPWIPFARVLRSATGRVRLARVVLQSLADASGVAATVFLPGATSRRHTDLQVAFPKGPVRLHFDENTSPPLHATAGGKCYLAGKPLYWLEEYLGDGLSACTAKTITSPEQLRRELALVREQGYALNLEESDLGVGAFAVPLHSLDGSTTGAVTLYSAIGDLSETNIRRWLPLLRSASRHLSHVLVVSWQERVADGLP
jgi:DNA-binding IclR family transcriptional regulator